ncbi:alpha-L-rhamnosidase C-terminal domain-containing protein [Mumia qirimensis]|uniref:alpha-L-rhamnosidase-related protein n=1 Tax=Mumia qirimensis TaxID=3234852 RepID=UPI00351D9D3F
MHPTSQSPRSRPRTRTKLAAAALTVSALGLCLSSPAISAPDHDGDRPTAADPWEKYILAPESRTVRADGVYASTGAVANPEGAFGDGAVTLGQGGQVTLDFGVNIAGLLNLEFGDVTGSPARVGIAFSETTKYVGRESEASTGGPRGRDGTVWVEAEADGSWSAPKELLRGAFRYVTLFVDDAASVQIDDVVVDYTAAPLMEDLRAYQNHFYSSSDLLNRLWYAGAYTTQINTIDPTTGRSWPAPSALWDNSATTGVGSSILVDGAKRDRTVWPGDLGISQGTAFVSTGDTTSVRNSIMTAYENQKATGELPYAGPELSFYRSDTYHMWTLLATAENYENTADVAWVRSVWPEYTAGLDYIRAKKSDRGLLLIDETNDTTHESRIPDGEESMANVMYWRLLGTGATLAERVGDDALAAELRAEAKTVAAAIDTYLWDEEAGALSWYPDRRDVHPQSANSLAVWWGLLDEARADRAMEHLRTTNWVERGARTPERDDDLQLLFGSFELQAQLAAGDPEAQEAAVDLMERQWGWMLDSPQGPQSTFWESLRESGEVVSSYQSYAHGWSTGPTRALTEQVLGIQAEEGGSRWEVDPHTAGLRHAEGRLVTAQGPIDASWTDEGKDLTIDFTTPRGTEGSIGVPVDGEHVLVKLDGRVVWNSSNGKAYGHPVRHTGERVYIDGIDGGHHTVVVRTTR